MIAYNVPTGQNCPLMLVLGIESTCDETACAVVENGIKILSNVISSQIDLHAQYGGVVPELACRRHVDVMIPVIEEALNKANVTLKEINLIAVAQEPGLVGAVLLGIHTAQALSLALGIPMVGVNHIEAHLYSAVMSNCNEVEFPSLGLVISGGHTTLYHLQSIDQYQILGSTRDDAVGEAFDKVAKLLGLSYPGGPQIEAFAKLGDPFRFNFQAGKVRGAPLDFSFSGLKTSVLYTIRDQGKLDQQDTYDIAASFQQAAFQDIVNKALLASEQTHCSRLLLGGGVTNNQFLRQLFFEKAPHLKTFWPAPGLTVDNAAMIAGLGYQKSIKDLRKGEG